MIHLGSRLTKCIENIESWMSSNRLRLNVTKTEILWFCSPTRLASDPASSIQITGSSIAPSKTVRSLGVLINSAFSFREQIAGLANTCYYHLRQLRSIRRSLSFDSSHALVRALILSRLDYCNGHLGGASGAQLDQMKGVMRASACFILQKSRNSHITIEMNTRLHWLDIRARIDYKLCVTTFQCLNGQALLPGFICCWSGPPALSGIRNVGGTGMQHQNNQSKGVCGVWSQLLEQSSSGIALQQHFTRKLQERTENSFIHPNACETTVIMWYECMCVYIYMLFHFIIHVLFGLIIFHRCRNWKHIRFSSSERFFGSTSNEGPYKFSILLLLLLLLLLLVWLPPCSGTFLEGTQIFVIIIIIVSGKLDRVG